MSLPKMDFWQQISLVSMFSSLLKKPIGAKIRSSSYTPDRKGWRKKRNHKNKIAKLSRRRNWR